MENENRRIVVDDNIITAFIEIIRYINRYYNEIKIKEYVENYCKKYGKFKNELEIHAMIIIILASVLITPLIVILSKYLQDKTPDKFRQYSFKSKEVEINKLLNDIKFKFKQIALNYVDLPLDGPI